VIVVQTRSKINLFLHLHGLRPDGKHELTTLFQAIDYGDELSAQACERIEFSCPDSEAGPEEENLVLRAARLLASEAGVREGVRLHLKKRVPVGAGLGGGSGDAAAALQVCSKLWGLHWSNARLAELAVQLGADVPFLLHGGAAWAEGIGEKLRPVAGLDERTHVLVVTPAEAVATGWAYRAWDEMFPEGLPPDPRIVKFLTLSNQGSFQHTELKGLLWNSFEPVVFARFPKIGPLGKEMEKAGASASLLSGSGSSVFGLFASCELPESLEHSWIEQGMRVQWCHPVAVDAVT